MWGSHGNSSLGFCASFPLLIGIALTAHHTSIGRRPPLHSKIPLLHNAILCESGATQATARFHASSTARPDVRQNRNRRDNNFGRIEPRLPRHAGGTLVLEEQSVLIRPHVGYSADTHGPPALSVNNPGRDFVARLNMLRYFFSRSSYAYATRLPQAPRRPCAAAAAYPHSIAAKESVARPMDHACAPPLVSPSWRR